MKQIIRISKTELHSLISTLLSEDRMNRAKNHMENHDCAFISTSRDSLQNIPPYSIKTPKRTKKKYGEYTDVYMGEHEPLTYGDIQGQEKAEKVGLDPSKRAKGVMGKEHKKEIGTSFTRNENSARNEMLKQKCLQLGYGVRKTIPEFCFYVYTILVTVPI